LQTENIITLTTSDLSQSGNAQQRNTLTVVIRLQDTRDCDVTHPAPETVSAANVTQND